MTRWPLWRPAGGRVAGLVVIAAAAVPGAARAQFTVSAVIAGGRPGTVYELPGDDCSDAAPRPITYERPGSPARTAPPSWLARAVRPQCHLA